MDKIFCLLSVVLYFFAPMHYSFEYCLVLFISVVFNAYYIFSKDKKNEIVGFNSIFSLSLILVTYIFPLFVYEVFPNYSLFGYAYNEKVITKSTALVNVAYSCYAVGYLMVLENKPRRILNIRNSLYEFPTLVSKSRIPIFRRCVLFLFSVVVVAGGLTFFKKQYSGEDAGAMGGILSFVWLVFQTFCILFTCINLKYNDKKSFLLLALIMFLLLAVGSRTLPLCIVSLIFYAFCLKRKYSLKRILLYVVFAFIVFSIVGRLRLGPEQDLSGISANELGVLNYFEDFIVCSRNQYVIYDFVQRKGVTFGISALGYVLAVVPFSQSIVCSLFGLSDADLRSEVLTTKWASSDAGLGTHIVGDVYLAFGLFGVIFLFYLLGYIVAKSRRYMFLGNRKGTIIYLILLSGAMFMCRGSYFYSLKNIVWSLIIVSLFGIIKKRRKK